jgi:hypothetical protein
VAEIEGPDEHITLKRAAELSGLTPGTLKRIVNTRRLEAEKLGRDWVTTRRKLHRYLESRDPIRRQTAPLPPTYRTPDGEEPIDG